MFRAGHSKLGHEEKPLHLAVNVQDQVVTSTSRDRRKQTSSSPQSPGGGARRGPTPPIGLIATPNQQDAVRNKNTHPV